MSPTPHPRTTVQPPPDYQYLEDRLALWLEGQGIQHWTPEVAEAAAGAGEGAAVDTAAAAEAVYYLTEDDVGEQQERENGYRRATPDFVFVDSNREVVQVPLQIKATPKKAELDKTSLFYASVIEVKGHISIPGLGSEEIEDKIGAQLRFVVGEGVHFQLSFTLAR